MSIHKDRLFDLIWYRIPVFLGIYYCITNTTEVSSIRAIVPSMFGAILYAGIMSRLDEIIHNNKQK